MGRPWALVLAAALGACAPAKSPYDRIGPPEPEMIPFERVVDIGHGKKKTVTVYDENANRLAQGRSLRKRNDTLFVDRRFAIPRRKVGYVTVEDPVPMEGEAVLKGVAGGLYTGFLTVIAMAAFTVVYSFYYLVKR